MDLVWIVIALIIAGFIGSRFAFAKEKLPNLLRDMFLTGWEFILIGMALGPLGFDLVTKDLLGQLAPFIALGLSWAGLIFGIQLRIDDLKKVEPGLLALTFSQATIVWIALFLLYIVMTIGHPGFTLSEIVAAAGMVAAAGAISSPTALALMASRGHRRASPLFRRLLTVAHLDVAPAIIGVGVVFLFFIPVGGGEFDFYRGITLLFYTVLIAAALAGLFHFFGRSRLKPEEDLTVLLGFLAFIAGVAFYLKLSPLFLSLLVGAILANTLKPDDPVFKTLFATEKPFYVIMLILVGLIWEPSGFLLFALALSVLLSRLWLKNRGARWAALRYMPSAGLPQNSGLALGAQGALALAIGINYLITYNGFVVELAFGVIALTTMINEVVAPFLIRSVVAEWEREKK